MGCARRSSITTGRRRASSLELVLAHARAPVASGPNDAIAVDATDASADGLRRSSDTLRQAEPQTSHLARSTTLVST